MKPDLVVMGHMMKETIKFPDQTLGPVLGGAAAYFSVVASKLGTHTGVVSKIGKDMPVKLLDPLFKAGVDTQGVITEGDKSRLSELIYQENGNKVMKYPCKGQPIIFEDIPDDYFQADMIYIAPQEWEVSYEVIEKIFSRNKRLAIELAGYGGTHCSYHSCQMDNNKFARQVLPYFHIAKLSGEDCQYIFGEISEREAAKIMIEWGVKIAIITLADRGAIVATADNIYDIPAFTQNAIDCTGAGDSFAAGFLVNYIQDRDAKKAGLFASATSSVVIEKKGGMKLDRMPTLSQVEERIKQWAS